ncbi:Uncharacterised protein [Bifidobacterium adolescentis]|nr:Uncharacterised protein [Bifidobacterium adolescentis]
MVVHRGVEALDGRDQAQLLLVQLEALVGGQEGEELLRGLELVSGDLVVDAEGRIDGARRVRSVTLLQHRDLAETVVEAGLIEAVDVPRAGRIDRKTSGGEFRLDLVAAQAGHVGAHQVLLDQLVPFAVVLAIHVLERVLTGVDLGVERLALLGGFSADPALDGVAQSILRLKVWGDSRGFEFAAHGQEFIPRRRDGVVTDLLQQILVVHPGIGPGAHAHGVYFAIHAIGLFCGIADFIHEAFIAQVLGVVAFDQIAQRLRRNDVDVGQVSAGDSSLQRLLVATLGTGGGAVVDLDVRIGLFEHVDDRLVLVLRIVREERQRGLAVGGVSSTARGQRNKHRRSGHRRNHPDGFLLHDVLLLVFHRWHPLYVRSFVEPTPAAVDTRQYVFN